MRWLAGLVLLGCSAAGEADIAGSQLASSDTETERDQETDAERPVRSELCFNPTSEFDAISPTARNTVEKVAARWRWVVHFDDADDCSVLTTGIVGDGDNKQGEHAPENLGTDAEPIWAPPGSYVGHRSTIMVHQPSLDALRIVDTSAMGCAAGRAPCYPLAAVLTHEIGHMLGVPHSDDPASPMRGKLTHASDPMPTTADLQKALAPAGAF